MSRKQYRKKNIIMNTSVLLQFLFTAFYWNVQVASGQCLRRSCDQTITGRQMSYSRALATVQSEEYLSEADLDFLKRRSGRLQKRDILCYQNPTAPSCVDSRFNSTMSTFDLPRCLFYAALTVAAIGAVLLPNPPDPIMPGQAPPDQPQPGTFGGGGLPIGNSATALAALALVPDGLEPVAIFPPYVQPRTVNAVSVIFSERPLAAIRRKRRQSRQYIKRRPVIERILARLAKNYKCYKARVSRRVKREYGEEEDNEVNSYDDCFDDIQEPLYGFRTRVFLVEDEQCELDVTCTIDGDRITRENTVDNFASFFQHRQTGEAFQSDAPADCRANAC